MKPIKLFLVNNNNNINSNTHLPPLWLTKDLMMYVGGKEIVASVDWPRSTRNCLFVRKKSAVDTIKKMHFFYPHGELFMVHQLPDNEEEEYNNDGDNDNNNITPFEFWYED